MTWWAGLAASHQGGEEQAGIGALRRTWGEEEHETVSIAGVAGLELGDDTVVMRGGVEALGGEG